MAVGGCKVVPMFLDPDELRAFLIAAAKARFNVTIEEVEVTKEEVIFRLPRALREPA